MVLGDITNTRLQRTPGKPKPAQVYVFREEGEKAAWANALHEQEQRLEALRDQLKPLRAQVKELRRKKAEAEQQMAVRQKEQRLHTQDAELRIFELHEGEAGLSAQLQLLLEELRPEEQMQERLNQGLQAKEAALMEDRNKVEELVAEKAAREAEGHAKIRRASALAAGAHAERGAQRRRSEVLADNLPRARALHNSYLNLKGNIRVFCRFRPRLPNEAEEAKVDFHGDEQSITLQSEMLKSVTGLSEHCNSYDFHFDHIFTPQSSQAEVFEELAMLVQSALDGYRVAIFAYGQTGGGKTYTMDGPPMSETSGESRGVIPRTVDLIFQEVQELSSKGWSFEVRCTLLEVYNESVFDILASRQKLDMGKETNRAAGTDGRQAIEHFTSRPVSDAAQVHRLLAKAARERHVSSTALNDRSSRSHSVFQLSLEGFRHGGESVSGLLSLVDLAGSERVSASMVSGDRLKEAQYINRSLSALGDVVEALKRKKPGSHVPYRNSRLTMLLKDSLGGDAKALMFVNVSPCLSQLPETLSSLRFAAKVHACEVGLARRHVEDASRAKESRS